MISLMAHRQTPCQVCGNDFDCDIDCIELERLKGVEDKATEVLKSIGSIDVLFTVLDRSSGNTISGDVWRLALELIGILDVECNQLEHELGRKRTTVEHLRKMVKSIENRWSEGKDG